MKSKNLLLALFCFLLSAVAVAQNQKGSVSGTVTTSDNNVASFVTVSLKGSGKITQTDGKGNYSFKNITPGNYIVKISAVGSKTKEAKVVVRPGQNSVANQLLDETAAQLEEVAVSGYKTPNLKPVSMGKSGIAAKDLPQSIQIITSQVIRDQQVDRLGDVMKNVNGVALGANRGSVGERFYARGYSLGDNNVLKNGARTTIGGSPEAATLASVEVLKGSAALLYGGITGGAVVNMTTKKPQFNWGGEVAMRAGSYDQYKPILDVYGPINQKLAFRIIGTGEKAGSFRDNVSSKRWYINPSLLYRVSDKTDILLQGDYLKSNYTPDFGIGSVSSKIVDLGRNKFLNTPWAYNHTNTATAQLNVNHNFNDNWKLNVIGSFQTYDRNYFGSERLRANEQGISERNLSRAKINEYTFNQQINLTGKVATGKIKHTFLVGADADQSRVASNRFAYGRNGDGSLITAFNYGNVNVYDPSTYYGSGLMPDAFAYEQALTPVYRYGAFVQDLIEFIPQLKLLAGLRYTTQKNAAVTTTNLVSQQQSSTKNKMDDAFSPKVGLVYEPVKTTSLYVSYANNFITNSGTDIYLNALAPSIVNQYEAGVKNDLFGGRLTANLTYYKIINSNVAQVAQFDVNGNANSNTSLRELTGETTSDGLEIDLTGTIVKGLNFLAGYAYNYMRYTNTADVTGMIENVRLVGTTKNTANGTLFYTVQKGKLSGLKLGASAYYTGNRNGGWNDNKSVDPSKYRLIPLKAFTTIDFSAGYTWSKLSLLAKMSNITNELNYFVHENYSVNPIAPRQFVATLSYKF